MFIRVKKRSSRIFFSLCFTTFFVTGCVAGDDLPCAARAGDVGEGYICVCNSTYCDTVESPDKLDYGLYYMYKTSNSTPGFTRTTGGFISSDDPDFNSTSDFIVNASTTYQEILGIGAAVTDISCGLVKNLPEEAQEKSYFGPNGIEYSMLRVPIGGTDFSYRSYTLDDVPYDVDLNNFSLADKDFNLRIPFIKKAMSLSQRGIKLLACVWAAPAWMKDGNVSSPSYISEKYNDAYARYHIRFLEEYQKQGLKVWSLSGGNEGIMMVFLMSIQTTTMNATYLLCPIERSWLTNNLKPHLALSNFSDVNFFTLEDQRAFAPYWMERMASDPKAYAAVDGIALHWYTDHFIPTSVMDDLHNKYPDKLILYTESSINGMYGTDPVVLGSWYRASGYLYNIFENLDKWTNVFMDWNMALDPDGGPTLSFEIEAPIIVNQTSGEFYKQPIFYAMEHASKFIPPGAVRVQVISKQNGTTVNDKNKSGSRGKDELRNLLRMIKPGSLLND